MAQSDKTPLEIMYEELIRFVATFIEIDYIFVGNRPDKVASAMSEFVVVDIPDEVKDMAAGNKDFALDTTGFIYVFCRAKSDSTLDQVTLSRLVYKIRDGFPMRSDHINGTKPRILPSGYDGNGFHIGTLSFRLRSKTNAFSNN